MFKILVLCQQIIYYADIIFYNTTIENNYSELFLTRSDNPIVCCFFGLATDVSGNNEN
jgi:hypothetical protein